MHKEETLSPDSAVIDAARTHLLRPEHLHEPAKMLRHEPKHISNRLIEPNQDSQEPALEEGELPEGEEQVSGSGADEPVEDTLHNQEPAAEVPESAAAPAAKRKRGERAGKRVRQRQAKRAREMELGLPPEGARPKHAPKRLVGKKNLPTCKYVLLPQRLQHNSVKASVWFLHLLCSCHELFCIKAAAHSYCSYAHKQFLLPAKVA